MGNSAIQLTKLKQNAEKLLRARKFQAAKDCYAEACLKHGHDPELRLNLGVAHAELGNYSEAARNFQQSVKLAPESVPAHLNLGRVFLVLGQADEAIECYRAALQLAPGNFDTLRMLAHAYCQAGNHVGAIRVYKELARLSPGDASLWVSVGNIHHNLGLLEKAASSYQQALKIDPGSADARVRLGYVLPHIGRHEEAAACFQAVLEASPDYEGAVTGMAELARFRGDYTQAHRLLRPRIDSGSASLSALLAYAWIAPEFDDTQRVITLLKDKLALASAKSNRSLHFTLGRLYDSEGMFDLAFTHFQEGNNLKQAKFPPEIFENEIDSLIELFVEESLASLPRSTLKTDKPVFIVGMLRSGSSLVEQILASHPDVVGAGELDELSNLVAPLREPATSVASTARLARINFATITRMSQRYLAHIERIGPNTSRVVDKSLINFLHLWLIELLFPGARIIHCMRHPLDTCLSCYFQDFTGAHHYTYDLATLGRFYYQYQRLMGHWSKILTIPIMEVSYEALVANPESQSRAIIDFCGLEWNDRCNRFYETDRSVITASSQQVRKPIYGSSMGRYRHYKKFLEPLKDGLDGKST